nr:phage antirepressor KilAC domain-containing protein [Brucella anthropi]
MNLPANIPLTMSSREIAELCNTRHNQVVETITRLFEKGVLRESRKTTRTVKPEGGGRPMAVYDLTKRDSLVVVSAYDDEIRAKVIDRWMYLETAASGPTPEFSVPQTFAEALRLAAEQTEKVERQALVIAELQEDAEALDQIANAHGSLTRTDAAKHLGVAPQLLCKWLNTHGWTYRRAGAKDDTAYQSKINAGYLEHKVKTGIKPDGTEWIGTQVRVTPKGLTVLAKAFPRAARAA